MQRYTLSDKFILKLLPKINLTLTFKKKKTCGRQSSDERKIEKQIDVIQSGLHKSANIMPFYTQKEEDQSIIKHKTPL